MDRTIRHRTKFVLALAVLALALPAAAQISGSPNRPFKVNGTPVPSPNLNGTTPPAGTNGLNINWQVSGSNFSGQVVGDGNAAHFLNGTGVFSAPAGGGISGLTIGQRLTTNGTTGIQTKGPTFDVTQATGATWDARLNFCLTNAAMLNGAAGTCDMTSETGTSSTTVANGVVAGNGQWIILPPVTLTFGNTFFFNVTGNNSGLICVQIWTCVLDASNNGSAGTVTEAGVKDGVSGVKMIGGRLNKQTGNEVLITGTNDWFWSNWLVNAGQDGVSIVNSGANPEKQASVQFNVIDQSGSAAILVNNSNNSSSTTLNDISYNLTRDANVNWNQNTQGTIGAGCSASNCGASPPTAHLADYNSIHDNIILNQYFAAADCNNPNFGTLAISGWSGNGATITLTYTSAQPAGGLPVVGQTIVLATFANGAINGNQTVTASTTTTISFASAQTTSTGSGTITYTPTSTDTGCSEGIQTTDSVWYEKIKDNHIYAASKEGIAFSGLGWQVTGNYCENCGQHVISTTTAGPYAWEKSSQVQASPGYVGAGVFANNTATNTSSTTLRYGLELLFTGTSSAPYTFQNVDIANNVFDGSGGSGGFTNGITLVTTGLTGGNVTFKNVRVNDNVISGSITTPFNTNSYALITGVAVCNGNGWNSSADSARGANDIVSFSSAATCTQPEVDSAVYALGGVIGWPATTPDTGISRDSAGVIDFGNGTATDKSATLQATAFKGVGTNGGISGTEGTGANAGTAGAGTDIFAMDSTLHDWRINANNVDFGGAVGGGTAAVTPGDVPCYNGTTGFRINDCGTPKLGTPASGVLTSTTGYIWNNLANPTGNFSPTMGSNTSIFNTTTALSQFFAFKNTTAAVVGTSQGSPIISDCGRSFHGSADVEDCLTLSELPGNGNDAAITFTLGHTGTSTGAVTFAVPGGETFGTAPAITTPGTGFYMFGTEGTEPASIAASTDGFNFDSTSHCPIQWNNSANVGCTAALGATQTWSAPQTFGTGNILLPAAVGTSAANGPLTLQAGIDATTTGASAILTLKGEDVSGGSTASLAGGATTVRGGDNASSGATETAGAVTLRGGDTTNASAAVQTTGAVTIRGGNNTATGAGPTLGSVTITGGTQSGAATNVAGADVLLRGGLGTGNATPAHVKLQSPNFSSTSGTTAQTQVTTYVVHKKAGSTTTATATNMFNIPVATNQTIGVEVIVHVETTQATPQNCSTTENFIASVQNTASTITQQSTAGTIGTICSTGTLTLAVAFSAATPSVFSVTPSWTTIVPTAVIITVEVHNLSQQDITLL